MEKRYDEYIGQSYHAMEKTNFYDAVYSPVILILNAVVVAVVMLLSSSGNPKVLTLFGLASAQNGLYTGHEFHYTKRFGQIIIRSQVKSLYLVIFRALGCRHNNRNIFVFRVLSQMS